jgi:hypothetical protein
VTNLSACVARPTIAAHWTRAAHAHANAVVHALLLLVVITLHCTIATALLLCILLRVTIVV